MKEPKFKMGQTVYIKGCSEAYAKSQPIVVGKIQKRSTELDGWVHDFWVYAEKDSNGFYPETCLKDNFEE
jgi:hypothetical protein